MTHRKRAFIRYAVPAMLCLALVFSSNLKSAPLASLSHMALPATVNDTTLYPALTDSFYHLPRQTVALPKAPEVTLNPQASRYVDQYIKKNGSWLQNIKDRSANHFRIIEGVFLTHNLPHQLKYLAVVESKLKPGSTSPMGAKGPWQLMPQTARELGLKVSGTTDERTHYYKSTTAAAKYLKRLHGIFDDWLLVIAAYNGGPGTVLKAIRLSGSRNFWKLQHHLPAETRAHVKHYIGVHYFFEGSGSATVLTKAEKLAFDQQWMAYQEAQQAKDSNALVQAKVVSTAVIPEEISQPSNNKK